MEERTLEIIPVELANGNILVGSTEDYRMNSIHEVEIDGKTQRIKLLEDVYYVWGYHESSLSTFTDYIWEAELIP